MLDRLIAISITHRYLVLGVAMLLAVAGGFALVRLPIDAVPDITNIQVQITTEIPALIPEDVERQVTWPIETAMAGIPNLDSTWSLSRYGFSQVTAIFKDGTDLYFARQQVAERLSQARDHLPPTADSRLGPIASGLGEVLFYTVNFAHPGGVAATASKKGAPGWQTDGSYRTSEGERLTTSDQQAAYLRVVQDWIVTPQLRGVSGIADVDTLGGAKKQYVVAPDPARLTAYGLSLQELGDALERNNRAKAGGFIERFGESRVVLADGRVHGVEDIGAIVVSTRSGTPILVRDVATVAIGHESRTGSASRDGREVVMGTVLMLLGSNARTVATAANARLQEIAATLPPDVVIATVLNRQTLVDAVIQTVATNLAEGALLVAMILSMVLGNLRGALVATAVIPLSMLLAAIGMKQFGISGNLMSLGAIDFGIIIDTAVIIIENCLRRLTEQRQLLGREATQDERFTECRAAAGQMVRPAVFGQLIIGIVYVPILLLSGIEGKMFHPMAATVILALTGAFILSLTVVPAAVATFARAGQAHRQNRLLRIAHRGYAPLVEHALRKPLLVTLAAVCLFVLACWIFSRLGSEFIPTLDEGNLAFEATRIPSIGMEQSTGMQLRLERAIKEIPEVLTIFSKTGTADLAFDPMPWNTSDNVVVVKPRTQWPDPRASEDSVFARIEAVANQQFGTQNEFSQPIQLRFNELIAGVKADVAVRLFGDDFGVLVPAAERVAKAMKGVRGAADVRVEQVQGASTLTVNALRDAAARIGISTADIQDVVVTATAGREVGLVFDGDRRFSMVVRLAEDLRNDPEVLKRLPIPLPAWEGQAVSDSGVRSVPMSSVATVQLGEGTNQISRDNGKRRIVVQCNVRGRDLGGFVEEAKVRVAHDSQLPTGTWVTWGGQYEHYQDARDRLVVAVPVCFLIILLLLYTTFGNLRDAALVFTAVPLALTGGVTSLWLRGMPFSISAAIGFIALSGVAVLNGVVLVSCINEMRQSGTPLVDAIRGGSLMRLRPVLMTALVASLGFIPMALSTSQGAEVQKPLATVVIGGILSSTILTLLVLPALYRLWHRERGPSGESPAVP